MENTFRLIVLSGSGDDEVLLVHETVTTPSTPSKFQESIQAALGEHAYADGRTTSSKAVRVTAIDSEIASRFLEDEAKTLPSNGFYSQRVERQDDFPSAAALSRHLGLQNNECSMYLNKVKHLPLEQRVAKIRGVSFMFLSDIDAINESNTKFD